MSPDQQVTDPRWHKAGDLRATITPFLANMTIGPDNFKWMLFGDDDTVFLIDNVMHMLPHLDPEQPYFITDHLWFPQKGMPNFQYITQQNHTIFLLGSMMHMLPCLQLDQL